MKADEYARRISESENRVAAAADVLRDIFLEFKEISERRRAKTDRASIAIIRELDDKWRAVCKRTKGLFYMNPDGLEPRAFRLYLLNKFPDAFLLAFGRTEYELCNSILQPPQEKI